MQSYQKVYNTKQIDKTLHVMFPSCVMKNTYNMYSFEKNLKTLFLNIFPPVSILTCARRRPALCPRERSEATVTWADLHPAAGGQVERTRHANDCLQNFILYKQVLR